MTIEWPPDEPQWIDARAMLEAGGPCFGDGADFVVCDPPPTYTLVVCGRPAVELIEQARACAAPGAEILAQDDNLSYVELLVPGRQVERLHMFAWDGEPPVVPEPPAARVLTLDDDLSHLPQGLRHEMERGRQKRRVWSVFVDGRAVCFAYAHRATASLGDISIDTVEAFRRRGFATLASLHLIGDLLEHGLRPTWGAYDSNSISRHLAARLGFRPAGHIWGLRAMKA